mgnify:CR=1 FL=1
MGPPLAIPVVVVLILLLGRPTSGRELLQQTADAAAGQPLLPLLAPLPCAGAPDDAPCDGGDKCTNSVCIGGQCVPGTPIVSFSARMHKLSQQGRLQLSACSPRACQ